jgi:hypothetical protein
MPTTWYESVRLNLREVGLTLYLSALVSSHASCLFFEQQNFSESVCFKSGDVGYADASKSAGYTLRARHLIVLSLTLSSTKAKSLVRSYFVYLPKRGPHSALIRRWRVKWMKVKTYVIVKLQACQSNQRLLLWIRLLHWVYVQPLTRPLHQTWSIVAVD